MLTSKAAFLILSSTKTISFSNRPVGTIKQVRSCAQKANLLLAASWFHPAVPEVPGVQVAPAVSAFPGAADHQGVGENDSIKSRCAVEEASKRSESPATVALLLITRQPETRLRLKQSGCLVLHFA